MAARGLLVALFGVGVLLGGCMQSTIEPASEANLTVRDKKLLAAAPYENAAIPEPYQRHIVEYHRKEAPGTIVIDSDARYLYYVLPDSKAIRYGVTVGEEAHGLVGRRQGRPHDRMAVMDADRRRTSRAWTCRPIVSPGPQNPMGARAMYLFRGQQGHALPHPRHQPAGIYRPGDFLGLHPHDQRGRHRPLQAGQDRHRRGGAGAAPGRLAVQSAAGVDEQSRSAESCKAGLAKTAPSGAVFVFQTLRRRASTRTISGGTPSRSGTLLQPRPPDTIMWRPCSTMWP